MDDGEIFCLGQHCQRSKGCIIEQKEGISRSRRKIKNCNLKLLVIDSSKNLEKEFFKLICNKTIIVLNKVDLLKKKEIVSKINYLTKNYSNKILIVSAKKGEGINNLLKNYPYVFDICHVLRYSPRFFSLKKSIRLKPPMAARI